MHIKRLVIKGFKSYLSLTDLEEFSPHYNAVVGRNGSGKSNLFAALQFVLSDDYGSLNPEQRQMLLHEGSGKEVFTAFVEVVFDNTDGRFPVDGTEVTIRRTVGAKKDEYYLDNKHATKQDVVNLLESAGFSRSNPYYIVQQGKIQELATMSEEARLDLLKEVAGTRVYDERRNESLRIMDDAAAKKQQVEEMLRSLATRLDELEAERAELLAFQKLDLTRRSLQYAIYEKDRERAQAKLTQIEQQRDEAAELLDEAERAGTGVSEADERTRLTLKTAQQRVALLSSERDVLVHERTALFQTVAELRLDVDDVAARLSSDESDQGARQTQLVALEKEISKCEKTLSACERKLAASKEAEAATADALRTQQMRLDELLQREARAAQFTTKKQRDAWLKSQSAALDDTIARQRQQLATAEQEAASFEARVNETRRLAETARTDFDKRRKSVQQAAEKLAQCRERRDQAAHRRKEVWRKDEELRQARVTAERDLEKAEKTLQSTLSRDVASGLAAMNKVVAEHNIAGVHGPLLDLFRVRKEAFETAVDVTGGASLFHVVVDTDDVATTILSKMSALKGPGRVTFLPLNRLNARQPVYPATEGVYSLVDDALDFQPRFKPAMVHVFGRTIACATLEQAASFSATHNLDCITLDGDRVDRKGALTGGFVDRRVSRLVLHKDVARLRALVSGTTAQQQQLAADLEATDAEITAHISAMQKAEEEKEKDLAAIEARSDDLRSYARAEQTTRAALDDASSRVAQLRTALADLVARQESLVRQCDAPWAKQLSEAEREEVNTLSAAVQQLRETAMRQSDSAGALEVERAQLRELLSGSLVKRRAELTTAPVVLEVAHASAELAECRRLLADAERRLAECDERTAGLERELDAAQREQASAQAASDAMLASASDAQKPLLEARKRVDELLNERALYARELEGAKRKIREVGTINSEEFQRYKNQEVAALYSALHDTQAQLQQYTHVNKKAGEQFVQFVEQRDRLMERNAKLDEGQASIEELVASLDARKDEAIIRTFKGVAKHFADVFKELVPAGDASLTMIKSATGKRKAGADEAADSGVLAFVGVRIKATFGGAMGAPQDIALLSGGQKSLVALALIFAIQRADPAPFYLMDEVDAALDSTHRVAVARMLAAQSKDAQYLVATFKPELVQPADRFYKISFANKVSHIRSVAADDALRVVQELMHEQQQQQLRQ